MPELRFFLDIRPMPDTLPEPVAAAIIGKARSTVRNWRHAHKPHRFDPPPAVRIGHRYVYPTAGLIEFVARTKQINRALVLA